MGKLELVMETEKVSMYSPKYDGENIKAIPTYITFPRVDKKVGKMRLYCLRLSDRILILGNGVVTTAKKNSEDVVLLTIIDNLRVIEHQIQRLIKQANTNCEDFAALKQIIETITL